MIKRPVIGRHYFVKDGEDMLPYLILVYNVDGNNIGGVIFDMYTHAQVFSKHFAPSGPEWQHVRDSTPDENAPVITKANLLCIVRKSDLLEFMTEVVGSTVKFFSGDVLK